MDNQTILENAKKYMEEVQGFIQNNHYQLVDVQQNLVLWKGLFLILV